MIGTDSWFFWSQSQDQKQGAGSLHFKISAFLLTLSMVFFENFADGQVNMPSEKPLVVATTGIIADMVRNIAGETVEIRPLMGPGVDPHLYKATYGDLKLLTNAQLVFYNGLHLEGKMQEVLEGLKRRKPVLALSDALPATSFRTPPEFAGQHDPHIWFNVELWEKAITTVQSGLEGLLPGEKVRFEAAAESYRARLEELHRWVKEQVALIPKEQRVLITAHDAFGYFGDAYGLEVAGLQGISTASEFGLVDIQRLTRLIIARNIKAIFVETSVPQRFILSIQQGVEAEGKKVAIGGTLYSDALGATGSGADTYEGMVRANVQTIVGALR